MTHAMRTWMGMVGMAATTLGAAQAQEAVTLELTRDGKPTATIVLAEKPTRAAQLAAAELQEHVRLITGATLPVAGDAAEVTGTRILVGESQATQSLGLKNADFKHQEYLIRFQPELLVLMGRDKKDYEKLDYKNPDGITIPLGTDEQGTCYAVYDFLERYCGVRWYLPTDLGTVYDANPTLKEIYCNPNNYPYLMAAAQDQDEKIAWEYLGTEPWMDKLERLMKEATTLAQAGTEKARVALFDKGIWQVMLKGRQTYLAKHSQIGSARTAPAVN